MIYRKSPPQAPRLLLRVVAGVGAMAAAASIAACSSSTSGGGVTGVVPESDGGDASQPCGDGVCGVTPAPDSGTGCGVSGVCDAGGIIDDSGFPGVVVMLDSGEAGPVGLVPNDSGADQ